jgi:hypothetical protein
LVEDDAGDHLERHLPGERHLERAEDRPHPPLAELLDDEVAVDHPADLGVGRGVPPPGAQPLERFGRDAVDAGRGARRAAAGRPRIAACGAAPRAYRSGLYHLVAGNILYR